MFQEVGVIMTKQCPICNFTLREHDEVTKEQHVKIHCHECGYYGMNLDCAQNFRRKFLAFDTSTVGGRELYDHNLRLIRSFLSRHHQDIITKEMIHDIVGLYIPRQ